MEPFPMIALPFNKNSHAPRQALGAYKSTHFIRNCLLQGVFLGLEEGAKSLVIRKSFYRYPHSSQLSQEVVCSLMLKIAYDIFLSICHIFYKYISRLHT
jgi:hypothetical protein